MWCFAVPQSDSSFHSVGVPPAGPWIRTTPSSHLGRPDGSGCVPSGPAAPVSGSAAPVSGCPGPASCLSVSSGSPSHS